MQKTILGNSNIDRQNKELLQNYRHARLTAYLVRI